MAPTPTVQMAVEHHHAAGGLAITASHNPVEWNALKFIGSSGLFLDAAEGAEMRAYLERGIPRATWDKLGTVASDDDAIDREFNEHITPKPEPQYQCHQGCAHNSPDRPMSLPNLTYLLCRLFKRATQMFGRCLSKCTDDSWVFEIQRAWPS